MRKNGNIALLVGFVCLAIHLFWSLIQVAFSLVNNLSGNAIAYFFFDGVVPAMMVLLFAVAPIVLFVRNRKNKTGKVLPLISIVLNSVLLLSQLSILILPAIPQYLLYSHLSLVDTYFPLVVRFLDSGGLLFVVGYTSLIIGSILSWPRKNG